MRGISMDMTAAKADLLNVGYGHSDHWRTQNRKNEIESSTQPAGFKSHHEQPPGRTGCRLNEAESIISLGSLDRLLTIPGHLAVALRRGLFFRTFSMSLPNNFNNITHHTEAIGTDLSIKRPRSRSLFSIGSSLVSPCVFCVAGATHRDKFFTNVLRFVCLFAAGNRFARAHTTDSLLSVSVFEPPSFSHGSRTGCLATSDT
jgi:hypothetical protein